MRRKVRFIIIHRLEEIGMIKDVIIGNKMEDKISEKGWYAELEWMYGDADGEDKTVIGPFPEQNKKLFIEFLNTLQLMIDKFKNGMGGLDDYDDVVGVNKFFSDEINPEFEKLTEEEKNIVMELSPTIKQIPDGSLSFAQLINFSAFWHDGKCKNRYKVELESEMIELDNQ